MHELYLYHLCSPLILRHQVSLEGLWTCYVRAPTWQHIPVCSTRPLLAMSSPCHPWLRSVSFAAVKRFLQEVESVPFTNAAQLCWCIVSLFYRAVFRLPRRQGMFFFSKATKLSSGRRVSRGFCPGMKRLEREADHPLPISRNIKSAWIYTRTAPYIFTAWDLIMHRD